MQRKLYATLCASAILAAGVTAASASSDQGRHHDGRHGLRGVALTADQKLLSYRTNAPERARSVGRIRGLSGDTALVGIDYRPATGDLYGVGNQGGVYVIDDRTAQATRKSRLSMPLEGTAFGVDFNPTVDRLRIVSDTGQNLRDNVDADGDTLKDGTLTYPGPPPATATGVTGAAYTNNDADPNTATTLYDLDSALDQVVIQSPANAGLLAPTGKLGARRRRAERVRHLQHGPRRHDGRRRRLRRAERGRPDRPLRHRAGDRARRRARLVPAAPRRGRHRDPDRAALTGQAARGRPAPAPPPSRVNRMRPLARRLWCAARDRPHPGCGRGAAPASRLIAAR